MLSYIIVSLLSLIVGAILYAKFGALAKADLIETEEAIKAEIISLRHHVTATAVTAKATAAKVESDAEKLASDAKL